jgi:rhodanese-related sulfurtransferase
MAVPGTRGTTTFTINKEQMLQIIKKLFGMGPQTDFADLVSKGAIIVDVRTPQEYNTGHISNALNIPVDKLQGKISELAKKGKPIITCCASGMRSAAAKRTLESAGITNVYNGGGWSSLNQKLKS